MAALLGAHIIKVKPPTDFLELDSAKKVYEQQKIDISSAAARYRNVVQACLNGGRIGVFSGGEIASAEDVYDECRAIRDGGGNGSIAGRNVFQRSREEALQLLDAMVRIYRE
jgi:class I fructose-bisphosphate aldolase